jgi:hypothetical protein
MDLMNQSELATKIEWAKKKKQKSATECRLDDSLQPFRRQLKWSGAVDGAGTFGSASAAHRRCRSRGRDQAADWPPPPPSITNHATDAKVRPRPPTCAIG